MSILRVDVLREYDIKSDPKGNQIIFSIKFWTAEGKLIFLPRAVAAGLRFNASEHRMRGVIEVDLQGNKIGHVIPVGIDRIKEWNGKTVKL